MEVVSRQSVPARLLKEASSATGQAGAKASASAYNGTPFTGSASNVKAGLSGLAVAVIVGLFMI